MVGRSLAVCTVAYMHRLIDECTVHDIVVIGIRVGVRRPLLLELRAA